MIKIFLITLLLSFSLTGFSKTKKVELVQYDVQFFDSSEKSFKALRPFATQLSQRDLKYFLFNVIVKELKILKMPWTHSTEENISDIFHEILTIFKYDQYIYVMKTFDTATSESESCSDSDVYSDSDSDSDSDSE